MSEKLEWIFELADKVSNPAGKAGEKVGLFEKALLAAAVAMASHTQLMEKNSKATEGVAQKHESLRSKIRDWVIIAREGGELIASVWNKVSAIGAKMLEGIAFKQNSVIALEAMSGTREEAIKIFEGVEAFAWNTGQSVESIMRETKDLMSAGWDPTQIGLIRDMLSDLRIVGKEGAAETIGETLANMGRAGAMTTREMMMLNRAGISSAAIYKELSDATGGTTAQVKKWLAQGLIPAEKGLNAIARAQMAAFKTDAIGEIAQRVQKTVPALLEKVKALPERIMDELVGFDTGAGGGPFAAILENIVNVFDPEGESGKRIIGRLRVMVDRIGAMFGIGGGPGGLFGELAGPNGAAKIEEVFNRIADAVERTIPKLQKAAKVLGEVAEVIGKVWDYTGGGKLGDVVHEVMNPDVQKQIVENAQKRVAAGRTGDFLDKSQYDAAVDVLRERGLLSATSYQPPEARAAWGKDKAQELVNLLAPRTEGPTLNFSGTINVGVGSALTADDVKKSTLDAFLDGLEQMGMETGN